MANRVLFNMGMELNIRRKMQLLLLFFLLVASFAAVHWIPWVFATSIVVVLLIVDYMFIDDEQFVYDPIYKNWARKTEPKY